VMKEVANTNKNAPDKFRKEARKEFIDTGSRRDVSYFD
jgi:hypothetical protein